MGRQVIKSVEIKIDINTAFDALIKPNAIKQWWSASQVIFIPQVGGIFAATWGEDLDKPDYLSVSKIHEINPPRHLSLIYEDYISEHGGLPFDAIMKVSFKLSETESGTKLEVIQSGFPNDPIADEYFLGCTKGWEDTLTAIKKYLES